MWQAIVIGAGAILVVGIAVAVAIRKSSQMHHEQRVRRHEAREPDLSSIPFLGNCSYCEGDVNGINGYTLECSHPIHYTCFTCLKNELRNYFNPNMMCKICLLPRSNNTRTISSQGPTKRTTLSQTCVICEKPVTGDSRLLPCPQKNHRVHQSCWERMKETSTTCPRCMDESNS